MAYPSLSLRAWPLDSIDAEDVRDRFVWITDNHGWSSANRAISLLRSLYRKPCADIETLHNPVSLWLDEGGRFHSKPRREISTPAEVLPRWRVGIEAEVLNTVIRDALCQRRRDDVAHPDCDKLRQLTTSL